MIHSETRLGEIEATCRELTETMRRLFEALAQRVEESVKIVAEGNAQLRTMVANIEAQRQTLEKRP